MQHLCSSLALRATHHLKVQHRFFINKPSFSTQAQSAITQKKRMPSPIVTNAPEIERGPLKVGLIVEKSSESLKRLEKLKANSNISFDWTVIAPEGTKAARMERLKDVKENLRTSDCAYIVTPKSLSLKVRGFKPLFVSFTDGKQHYRVFHGKINNRTPIVRAISKSNKPLSETFVVDATAGLGTDAFVMASVGCRVTLVEENPHLYNLLQQAYEIAQSSADAATAKILKRMSIINADSREYLPSLIEQDRPDVVYLDTMYPAKQKTKKVIMPSREISIIRKLVGESDSVGLLKVARQTARECVVFKRPYYVEADPAAYVSYHSKATHYDVYRSFEREQKLLLAKENQTKQSE